MITPRTNRSSLKSPLAATAPTSPLGIHSSPTPHGLPRQRLLALLPELWKGRFGLVVAPAGSGKTTLLAQFAAGAGCPFAYHCAEGRQAGAESFLAALGASLAPVVRGIEGVWRTVDEAALSVGHAARERRVAADRRLPPARGDPGRAGPRAAARMRAAATRRRDRLAVTTSFQLATPARLRCAARSRRRSDSGSGRGRSSGSSSTCTPSRCRRRISRSSPAAPKAGPPG